MGISARKLAAASLIAVTACNQTTPRKSAGKPPKDGGWSVQPFQIPASSTALDTCVGVPEPATVVRIVIPKNLTTTDKTQWVRYKKYSRATPTPTPTPTPSATPALDDEVEWKSSSQNTSSNPDYQTNPFHLDLTTLPVLKDEWVKVRVFLKDKAYRFFDHSDSPIWGIAYDKGAPFSRWFCQKDHDDALSRSKNDKHSVLTFYLQRVKGGGEASVNFVIEADPTKGSGATGGYKTPILIDPKIQNDG